jgi:hypothetical protein
MAIGSCGILELLVILVNGVVAVDVLVINTFVACRAGGGYVLRVH